MTERRKYRGAGNGHVFNTLRREILAARLKVILDEELDRPPSVKVKRLAAMDLPRIVRSVAHDDLVTDRQTYVPTKKDKIFRTLRREILAARLKVTLDEQLVRQTPKLLSEMKLPPIVKTYDPTKKEQVFATLRREILAARLKVTMDEQLGRETSPRMMRLSKMTLPPRVRRPKRQAGGFRPEPAGPASLSE